MKRSALALAVLAALLVATPASAAPPRDGARDWSILQGREAEPGAWPAQVALLDATAEDVHAAQFCGGTLVAATVVLTAAHCVATTGGFLLQPPDAIAVGVGVHDLADPDDGEVMGVQAVYAHPDYLAPTSEADIALLGLVAPVDPEPQRLIADDETDLWAPGTTATVVGWGSTDPDGTIYPTRLREGEVPMADSEDCARAYFDFYGDQLPFFPDVMNCAGDPGPDEHEPGPDTCFGDSGGPLLVPHPDGGFAQAGITSFGGPFCGAEVPGAYTRVDAFLDFIDAVVNGEVPPSEVVDGGLLDLPPGEVLRVEAGLPTLPAPLASAVSAVTFPIAGSTPYAVVASAEDFPDALAGSALAFGIAPLLFTAADGPLDPATAAELTRVVVPGSEVYVLGGEDALGQEAVDDIADLGFGAVRLAGATREETAVAVFAEISRQGDRGEAGGQAAPPGGRSRLGQIFGAAGARQDEPGGPVILATSGHWPDAVAAAQLGASLGFPILLTPPDALHPATAAVLEAAAPEQVLAIGGTAAISDDVLAEVAGLTGGRADRLGGATRIETALTVAAASAELFASFEIPVGTVTAANLRVDDGFAHHLAASMIPGASFGITVPVDGYQGEILPDAVPRLICGLGETAPGIVVGGTDVVAEPVLVALAEALNAPCG